MEEETETNGDEGQRCAEEAFVSSNVGDGVTPDVEDGAEVEAKETLMTMQNIRNMSLEPSNMSCRSNSSSVKELTDKQRLCNLLTTCGMGSLLRGWRRELDPDGSFDIPFVEFMKSAARIGFIFEGDWRDIFGVDEDLDTLAITELSPKLGELLESFRKWCKTSFGSAQQMFDTLTEGDTDGQLDLEEFIFRVCARGFVADEEGIRELFECCDADGEGRISRDEIVFIEADHKKRELEQYKIDNRAKEQHQSFFTWFYHQEKAWGLMPTHRLAMRPWTAGELEQLPSLLREKRMERRRRTAQRGLQARTQFLEHLRHVYGNEVRAWRRALDPKNHFSVNQVTLNRYLRRVDFKCDSSLLWKALDMAGEGSFVIENIAVHLADLLASFRRWAQESFGCCARLWDSKPAKAARSKPRQQGKVRWPSDRWPSDKKMLCAAFTEALLALDCPHVPDRKTAQILTSSLDLHGCGLVTKEDLEWLDCWNPQEWLSAEPEPESWEQLKALMMRRYGHMLRVWRGLLDTDNSNIVSWKEFQAACKKIRFQGNIGGAWRALDTALLGRISLKQVDPESAEVLTSFKDWTESNFGSVLLAFAAFDRDGGGSLTYSELRNACNKYKWQGHVRTLFDSLDVAEKHTPGKRSISIKEIAFLDTWDSDPDALENVSPKVAELPPPLSTRREEERSWQNASMRSTMSRSSSDPSFGRSARSSPKKRLEVIRPGTLPDVMSPPQFRSSDTFEGGRTFPLKASSLGEASFCKSYGFAREDTRPRRGNAESLPPISPSRR